MLCMHLSLYILLMFVPLIDLDWSVLNILIIVPLFILSTIVSLHNVSYIQVSFLLVF